MDQQKFLQQLQIVLNPSQGNVKTATATLQKEFYSKPESLAFLLQILTSHKNAELRQLAAVEARTLVAKHWTSVPAAQRPQIRNSLLQSTLAEEKPLVRHSSARVISAIAKIDLEDGEWADLPATLRQISQSQRHEERAVGVYLLFTILEVMGEGFKAKLNEFFALFQKTIQDPESFEVQVNTLLALGTIAVSIDSDEDEAAVQAFQNFLPPMVNVLKVAIDSKDEDRITQAFEVFQTLLSCDPGLTNTHLKDLVLFMNQIASNDDVEEDSRIQAISFLMQAVRFRKLKIQGLRLGEQLTLAALKIVTELGDEDTDEDEITPARSALGLLELLAQSLPSSQVVVPLLNGLGPYFNNNDPDYRRAGILSLGFCVEGAPDFFSTQMKEIFPAVLRLLADSEPKVRQATLHTVARLADDLPEDLGREHEKLMPLLVQNLTSAMQEFKGEEEGPNVDIMKAGVSAIDAVVDGLSEEDVAPYQKDLVPLLHKLFNHPDYKIKALTASAIGSLASSAGESFLPYFDESMNAMQHYATIKDSEEDLELRASVTDAMGEMSTSAGPEHFKKYVQPLMQASGDALNLGHSRLKETTYIFWGSMSKVYGEDFAPFLDGVVKGLFNCIDQEEADLDVELGEQAKDLIGQEVTIAGRKVKVAAASDDDLEGEIEDVEVGEDDEDDWDDFNTVTPLALEKEIAVEVIGDIVSHTKKAYLPYFEKTIEQIMPLVEHPYEGVRKATISTLHRAYASLWDVSEEEGQMPKWEAGLPLKVEPTTELKKFAEILMTATLTMWGEEDDSQTVTEINRNVAENLKFCGPYLISSPKVLENVITIVTSIINKKHTCQQDDFAEIFGAAVKADPDVEGLEESSELDWIVVDTALDVVSGMAVALGSSFTELWKIFEKTVLRYAGSSESIERSTAVGVLAECIAGMGSAVTPHTSAFLKLLLHRLSDEDAQTRSNAAYAIGRLVEKSDANAEIVKAYPTMLQKLEPFLTLNEARCKDNAAGCISRMIAKHKDSVPMGDVLPALVGILPLKDDYEENTPVWKTILGLYKQQDQTILGLTPQILTALQSVLSPPEDQIHDDELREELKQLGQFLSSQ